MAWAMVAASCAMEWGQPVLSGRSAFALSIAS